MVISGTIIAHSGSGRGLAERVKTIKNGADPTLRSRVSRARKTAQKGA